jgi:hypothetical protein
MAPLAAISRDSYGFSTCSAVRVALLLGDVRRARDIYGGVFGSAPLSDVWPKAAFVLTTTTIMRCS